ncbi:hypothetical protein ACHAWO_005805 [Cyclotella atomus]|uniref:Uncharacterized protein n=1 Tax=Cyclotella atomus TaxID=382360 RepID=A0ABD3P1N8_9STRA
MHGEQLAVDISRQELAEQIDQESGLPEVEVSVCTVMSLPQAVKLHEPWRGVVPCHSCALLQDRVDLLTLFVAWLQQPVSSLRSMAVFPRLGKLDAGFLKGRHSEFWRSHDFGLDFIHLSRLDRPFCSIRINDKRTLHSRRCRHRLMTDVGISQSEVSASNRVSDKTMIGLVTLKTTGCLMPTGCAPDLAATIEPSILVLLGFCFYSTNFFAIWDFEGKLSCVPLSKKRIYDPVATSVVILHTGKLARLLESGASIQPLLRLWYLSKPGSRLTSRSPPRSSRLASGAGGMPR